MISFSDYTKYDGLGVAELVRRKEVSPDDLLDTALAAHAKVIQKSTQCYRPCLNKLRQRSKPASATDPFAACQ